MKSDCGCPVGAECAKLTQKKNTPTQEGCEGLEIDKDDRRGGVVRASGSASTTAISIQTAHNPRTEEIA